MQIPFITIALSLTILANLLHSNSRKIKIFQPTVRDSVTA